MLCLVRSGLAQYVPMTLADCAVSYGWPFSWSVCLKSMDRVAPLLSVSPENVSESRRAALRMWPANLSRRTRDGLVSSLAGR